MNTQDWDEIEALRESLREHMAEIHRLRVAGRQALEALCLPCDRWNRRQTEIINASITTLRDELAEANIKDSLTIEPVAYVTGYFDGRCVIKPIEPVFLPTGMALYRSPPKREPLTAPQIHELDWPDDVAFEDILKLTRAVERAHDIGGEE